MPKIRNNRNICLYCFGDLNEDRVCVSCGKKADDKANLPHHLKKRSLLQKRYLIDHAIGEGGFGITYLAWDVTVGRKVAIKEYYPSGYVSRDPRSNQIVINSKQNHAASNRGLKRFIDEAKNLTTIKNLSGIVNVFDFFSANATAYIVMEFLDGISLKRYVKRKGKLDVTTTLTILKPVILSLAEVHSTGLIHRDISPDNILITKTNEVKLIDFGASKAANPGGQSVSIVLKQGFAPEEQYRLHGEQGPWTDIYALGVTIYYCITGQLPPESIQRMYDDNIIPPSKLGADIEPNCERALMKAIAVFAKDRYRSIEDFARDVYRPIEKTPEQPAQEPVRETITTAHGITLRVEEDGQLMIDPDRSAQIPEEPIKKEPEKPNVEQSAEKPSDEKPVAPSEEIVPVIHEKSRYRRRSPKVNRRITPDIFRQILSGKASEQIEIISMSTEIIKAQEDMTDPDNHERTRFEMTGMTGNYDSSVIMIPTPSKSDEIAKRPDDGKDLLPLVSAYKPRTLNSERKYDDFAQKLKQKFNI